MNTSAIRRGFGTIVLLFCVPLFLVAVLDATALSGIPRILCVSAWCGAGLVYLVIGMARLAGFLPDERIEVALSVCVVAQTLPACVAILATGDPGRFISIVIAVLAPAGLLTSWRAVVTNSGLVVGAFGAALVLHPGRGFGEQSQALFFTLVAVTLVAASRLYGLHQLRGLTLRLRDSAAIDQLTGLLNRRGLDEQLNALVADSGAESFAIGVLWVDLDGFKRLNDDRGHAEGDRVLQEAARRILELVRESDIVARVGGDEFVIVLPAVDPPHAEAVRHRLTTELKQSAPSGEPAWSASVGLAHGPCRDQADLHPLLRQADLDMYDLKQAKARIPLPAALTASRR